MNQQMVISYDLDGVVMQNPFEKGIGPHIRGLMRDSPGLADLSAEEADRRTNAAIREAYGRRLAAGDHVAGYDWDTIYAEVSQGFSADPVPDVAELVRHYCDQEGMIGLLPGARRGLERLREHGFRVLALTNGYHAYQWPVLQALGVAELFDAIITPEAAGFAKPDPRYFGTVPGLLAHVGDTLIHDVLGANLAVITSVWLDARLPREYRELPIEERVVSAGFAEYLERTLSGLSYLRYHPEATPDSCTPAVVVVDADEAATALIERFS